MTTIREGFHQGARTIVGPAVCQGCRALVWFRRDAHGQGWRDENEYGAMVPHRCPAKAAAA